MRPKLNRREFLRRAAIASGAVVAASRRTMAFPRGDELLDPFGGLKVGVQSYCFHKVSLEQTIKMVESLGLRYMEIFPGHLPYEKFQPNQISEVKKRLQEGGIRVPSYGVVSFRQNTRPWEKVFEFARAFELETLSADLALEGLDELDKLVEEFSVNIGIHSHWSPDRHENPRDIWNAVRDHHPRIGAVIDTGNIRSHGYDPLEAMKLFQGRVFGLHLKDISEPGKSCVLGRGRVDIPAILRELRSGNFAHILAIEYEEEPENPVPSLRTSLEFVEQSLSL